MKRIKHENWQRLNVGDIIAINCSIELVTHKCEHTFYSAPLVALDMEWTGEPMRRSSHWVCQLDEGDDMIVFESIEDVMPFLKEEYNKLKAFYFDEA